MSPTMSLKQLLHDNNWTTRQSPDDGHCLLHSTEASYASQLPMAPKLSLSSLISKIVSHVSSCIEDYTIYGISAIDIKSEMNDYIYLQLYNSNFSDLVPLIIARVLDINVLVLDTDRSGNYKSHLFEAQLKTTTNLALQRIGDHYNAIVTARTVSIPAPLRPCASTTTHRAESSTNNHSVMPIPPQSCNTKEAPPPVNVNEMTPTKLSRFTYDRDTPLSLNDQRACHLTRKLRKSLISLSL